MIQITSKGLTLLETIEPLSESDIRLLSYIANEKQEFEPTYKESQIKHLKELGYLREI